ncbi:hypothetical protein Efla_006693 [Eimeria flavescens]
MTTRSRTKGYPWKNPSKKVTENQLLKISEEGERGGNGCALPLISAVGQGADPAEGTPEPAAVKGAICIAFQDDTIKMELVGKTKNTNKGDSMCEGILTLGPTANRSNTKLGTWLNGQKSREGAVHRVVGEEPEAQREIPQELKEIRWISWTSSPFAAPIMVVTKTDHASEQKQVPHGGELSMIKPPHDSGRLPATHYSRIRTALRGPSVY